jgi:hypothetical protein
MEYIRQGKEIVEKGLFVELGAYQYHIFMDFREVWDYDGYYWRLASSLNGRGVPSIDEAFKELYLEPILVPFKSVLNKDVFLDLSKLATSKEFYESSGKNILDNFQKSLQSLYKSVKIFVDGPCSEEGVAYETVRLLDVFIRDVSLNGIKDSQLKKTIDNLQLLLNREDLSQIPFLRMLWSWIVLHQIGKIKHVIGYEDQGAAWMDEWLLKKIVKQTFQDLGCAESRAQREAQLLKLLIRYQNLFEFDFDLDRFLNSLNRFFADNEVKEFLGFNWYDGMLWLNKEALEDLFYWLYVVNAIKGIYQKKDERENMAYYLRKSYEFIQHILKSAEYAGYKVEEFLRILKQQYTFV